MRELRMVKKEKYRLTSTEYKISLVIAKVIVVILAVFAYLLRFIFIALFKSKKWLYRFSIAILITYSALNTLNTVAYAPKSEAQVVLRDNYTVKEIVISMARYEFGEDQLYSLEQIIYHESGFNPKAINKSSGACGLFQSLPCEKMLSMSLQDQIQWGFNYIKKRYKTPNNAWTFWLKNGWY